MIIASMPKYSTGNTLSSNALAIGVKGIKVIAKIAIKLMMLSDADAQL